MTKIVINRCFGGFSLSPAAMQHYATLLGTTLYPEEQDYGTFTYWTVPPNQRPEDLTSKWMTLTQEERITHNKAWVAATISPYDIARDDPHLVATVEALGPKVNGRHANLQVVEIPDDVQWHISDHDGLEHIAENHRTWP